MSSAKKIVVRRAYRVADRFAWFCLTTSLILFPGIFHPTMAIALDKSEESVESNRLVICLPTSVNTFDPANHRSRITQIVLKNIFDSLTTRDNANHVLPQLAESWRLIDNTHWQFKLRRGVRFHDGHKLTAADVQFSLERIIHEDALDGRTSPRKSLLAPIAEVSVEDDYTVRVATLYPWPNLPLMLSLQEIVPAAYMRAVGSRGFEAHPVGAGPFRFIRNEAGQVIVLERFIEYYGGSPERPPVQTAPLKQLVFKVVPSRLDQLAMLKAGRCDIVFSLPPESIPILRMSPRIRILRSPATRSYFAEINCRREPLNDRRVRQALNYAVDIQAIVKNRLQGHGKVISTILLPNTFGYDSHLAPYPYDPSVARRLLAAAGFPSDRPMRICCARDDTMFADSIVLFLTKLGLQAHMTIEPLFRPQVLGGDAPWDIFVGSWGNSTLDPAGIFPPKFGSNAYGNYSGYASSELDRLMLEAQRTMDRAQRIDIYHRIQKIIFDEAPMIFGYAQDEYYGVAKRVKNFSPSATGMIDMHDVYVEDGD